MADLDFCEMSLKAVVLNPNRHAYFIFFENLINSGFKWFGILQSKKSAFWTCKFFLLGPPATCFQAKRGSLATLQPIFKKTR